MVLEILLLDRQTEWRRARRHEHPRHLVGSLDGSRLGEREAAVSAVHGDGVPGRFQRRAGGRAVPGVDHQPPRSPALEGIRRSWCFPDERVAPLIVRDTRVMGSP